MTVMKQVKQFQYNISYTNDTNIYFVTETQEFRHFRRVITERIIKNILRIFLLHVPSRQGPGLAIPGGVTGDFFRSYRQNHVPWGRLSL